MTKLLALALLSACGTTDQPTIYPPGTLQVHWSPGTNTLNLDVTCTNAVSHPCPLMLYTTRFSDAGDQFVWDGSNGMVTDAATYLGDGSIYIPSRGDDAGLRAESVLTPTADGFTGSISWNLFSVRGSTSYAVTLSTH